MDTGILIVIGAIGLIVVLGFFVALNRSWGSFPTRAGGYAPQPSDMPAPASLPVATGDNAADTEPIEPDDQPVAPIPISNPMVRRAVETAIANHSPVSRYILRQGNDLYFSFDTMPDPDQRRQAYHLMRRFEAGEDVDIGALMRLLRQIIQ
ncbi:MAG TPA: hypothetical protein VFZ66_10155 [Herpetosiphonaceae bacterium]